MEYTYFDVKKYPTVSAKEGYGAWAKTYENSVEDTMDLRLLERIKGINWPEITSAVDLACGTGRIGMWLHTQGVDALTGIDFTPEMLSKAQEKEVYAHLMQGDILATGLPDKRYDLSIEVLADEHLADLVPLYAEAARLTKAGGYFVIVGYHPHFLMNGLVTHYHKENGDPVAIRSYVHLLSDHIKAAYAANLDLLEMEEGIIDEDWLAKKPKWKKYQGRPVSFMMVWQTQA